jgi:F-box/WD-40 domain protein 7
MPVDCLLAESGYLFAGVSQKLDSAIKVWNLGAGGAQHELTGHQGQVLALAVAPQSGLLFSGGLDATIRVWELNAAAGTFACTATLTKDAGGHRAAVHALLVAGQFLFSGDRAGAVKAWSLASGQCVQTVERAHSGPIMRMLLWGDNYLLTAAMDGSIRCWSPSSGAPGAPVLNPEPEFVFTGDDSSGGTSGGGGASGGGGGGGPGAGAAILTMCACSDAAGQSVLMVSYLGDRAVRLFDLPSFDARGCLPNVHECRALLTLPEANTMLASDRNGAVKIFQWKAPPMAA